MVQLDLWGLLERDPAPTHASGTPATPTRERVTNTATAHHDVPARSVSQPVWMLVERDAPERAPALAADAPAVAPAPALADADSPPASTPTRRAETAGLDAAPRRWPRERDFHITPDAGVGQGSPAEKIRRNLEALRTLKTLEAAGRAATPAEQAVLVRYCGWGAFPRVFESYPGPGWRESAAELHALVTPDEWESLRASTPNAHYTTPLVIDALWTGVVRLGLQGPARVLEPALGVGHFFGCQPDALTGPRTGIELDTVSARIAALLYPDSAVRAGAFEAQPHMGGYDLVISNVPFGNYGVVDPAYGRRSVVTRSIHDYFIGRALDEVRPGGLVAVITSRYTLDKVNDDFRAWVSERADLLGALRLPCTAFRENAGTDVVTDVLFLQRRFQGGGRLGADWLTSRARDAALGFPINDYFHEHPEQVLGTLEQGHGLYGQLDLTVTGTLTAARLHDALECLPRDVVPERGGRPSRTVFDPMPAPEGVKAGAFVVHAGRLCVADSPTTLRSAELRRDVGERVLGMVAVRDAALTAVRRQVDGSTDEAVHQARTALNHAYDAFVARFGPLSSPANRAAFASDPDAPLLLSLEERYDREGNRADKAAIFSRRTVEPYTRPERADTAAEALAISLAETGGIDWPRVASLLGRPAHEAVAELGELVFEDPASGEWVTREEYLSGNVRVKLAQARAAVSDPAFARNVAALEAVQPRDLTPAEIKVSLGAAWIPPEDVLEFARHLFEQRDCTGVAIEYAAPLATWIVRSDHVADTSVANRHTWGTERAPALGLLEDALNQRVPTVADYDATTQRSIPNLNETLAAREKQQALRDEFERWLWSDDERATRLARCYNDTFNNARRRIFDGGHLHLPGINRLVLRGGDLAPHQKDGVWRVLQQRSTLLALPVGAGKTYTMVAAVQEALRIGVLRKALFVVPTALVEQWGAEFYRLYPQARVLVGTREHLADGRRQQFLARCATSDYDAVIVAHSSFGKLPLRAETQAQLLRRELQRLKEALEGARADKPRFAPRGPRSIVKELEKAKKRLEVRIGHLMNAESKDRALCFEDLGFDALLVDEAHAYKNLMLVTKMSRVAGLPSGESERAWDMYAKTRHVLDRGGRIVFATGTPVTNTLAEVYTLQRFLQEERLEQLGIAHFDAWAATFAQTVTAVELAPDGSGYRSATRFAAFNNAPELSVLLSQVTELRTEAELDLPRPRIAGGGPEIVVVPGSEALRAYVSTLGERAERIRRGHVDARVDNMLKVTGDGRRAALDLREIGLPAAPSEERKLSAVAERVRATWEATQAERATQVVFCDLSTPKSQQFSFYTALRDELVERGVPAHEVRFIHDAEGDREKLELFQALNEGRVRVVLGSTEKLGTGANFQARLIAAHHVDAPWRPADVEQRNGRILRPGNRHAQVSIHYYVTAGSFDSYMWQCLERKQRFIDQLMRGEVTERSIEDIGGAAALTAAEAKALASGNPEILEVVKLDTEIRRLSALEAHNRDAQRRLAWELSAVDVNLTSLAGRHGRVLDDLASARERWTAAGERSPGLTLAGRVYAGDGYRKPAAAALERTLVAWDRALRTQATRPPDPTIGSYLGFALRASRSAGDRGVGLPLTLRVVGREAHDVAFEGVVTEGTIASIEAQVHPRRLEQLAQTLESERARQERRREGLRAEAARPVDDGTRLAELRRQRDAIVERLQLTDGVQEAVALDVPVEVEREVAREPGLGRPEVIDLMR